MELLKTKKGRTSSEAMLRIFLNEELTPYAGLLPDYYVLGSKVLRDLVIAAKIAGEENMDARYSLVHLGEVPRGMTLNLVKEEYREAWEAHKGLEAVGYRSYATSEMLANYRRLYEEDPECLLVVKPKYANRIYVVKESVYARGALIMGTGIPLIHYQDEYDETLLAVGRPLLFDEVEYLPLET